MFLLQVYWISIEFLNLWKKCLCSQHPWFPSLLAHNICVLSWFETKKSMCNSYMMTSFISCDKCVENANFSPTSKSLCIVNPSMLICFLCIILVLETCGRGGNVLTMNFASYPSWWNLPIFSWNLVAQYCIFVMT